MTFALPLLLLAACHTSGIVSVNVETNQENVESVVLGYTGSVQKGTAAKQRALDRIKNGKAILRAEVGSGASTTITSTSTTTTTTTTTLKSTTAALTGHATGHVDGVKSLAAVGTASATILLGVMVTVMSLFYLVNHSDKDIQKTTWKTISNTISLFCAVLIFKMIKGIMGLWINEEQFASFAEGASATAIPASHPTEGTLACAFIRFIISFVIVQAFLLRMKHYPVSLAAWGSIGAYVIGFMGADAFGTLLTATPWVDNPGLCTIGLCLAASAMATVMWCGNIFRIHVARMGDDTISAVEKAWEDQCIRTENEFFAFTVGLCITQICRFAIVGEMPPFHGPQQNNNLEQIHQLLLVASGFAVFTMISDVIERFMEGRGAGWTAMRVINVIQDTSSITFGWCLLFWGKWWFWYMMKQEIANGDVMTGQIVMAVVFSAASFACIFVFDFIADRLPSCGKSFRSLIEALILLMGLSWESCYVTSIAGAVGAEYTDAYTRVRISAQLCCMICFLILPAWIWYIFPKGMDEKKIDEGGSQDRAPEAATEEGTGAASATTPAANAAADPTAATPAAEAPSSAPEQASATPAPPPEPASASAEETTEAANDETLAEPPASAADAPSNSNTDF